MISLFFFGLGVTLGWWVRGTRAGQWFTKAFSSAPEVK